MTNNNTPTITRDGVIGQDGSAVVTVDQATGAEFARYPVAGKTEADAAVAAARSVSGAWWDLGFEGRAQRLRALRREIALGGEEGAELIHAENGKPLDEARVEVLGTLEHLKYVIDNAERVLGRREVPDSPTVPNQRAWVEYQPYGVVGVIGPWNFPLLTPVAIVADALAAGNAVVLKPSQITPGVAQWLIRSWQRAVPDLPDVLQNLNGFGATGGALIEAGLDKLAFTGSVATGKTVAAQCAQTLTPVLLELGGKDGVIVAEDADLDEAAAHIVWGSMVNTGHGCISLEVAYVVESVHDELVEKISDLARKVRVGSDEDSEIGPVPLPTQTSIIRAHIKDALERGARATVGGLDAVGDHYVAPTILVGVSPEALAATEETFGPTLAIIKIADTDEAIAHINAGRYGLGSAVFSRNRGEDIARRLHTGMTSINDALVFSMNPAVPFGGRSDSGYGRKQGEEGLREFAYPHSFTVKTGPAQFSASTFGRPPGALAGALAGIRNAILAEENKQTG
ncbi:aldehyde dehydrogenase (NAD+) [Streptomyces sp. 846.5]|nr:aldehyde dehydrogenase family protein [Streptomyces sp. 846.5]TDU05950.1 aldehyde dehydrogenase (NAD+) [Streptomyces sp. 846.5]